MTNALCALHLTGREINTLGSVHAMQEELEKRGFTLKMNQMFSVQTTPEKFETALITGHFAFALELTSGRGRSCLSQHRRSRKSSF